MLRVLRSNGIIVSGAMRTASISTHIGVRRSLLVSMSPVHQSFNGGLFIRKFSSFHDTDGAIKRPGAGLDSSSTALVKDAKQLAHMAVTLIPVTDLEIQLRVLQKFHHSDTNSRTQAVADFMKNHQTVSSSWLGRWICKSFTEEQVKVFPIHVPLDRTEALLAVKAELASVLYGIRALKKTPTAQVAALIKEQQLLLLREGSHLEDEQLLVNELSAPHQTRQTSVTGGATSDLSAIVGDFDKSESVELTSFCLKLVNDLADAMASNSNPIHSVPESTSLSTTATATISSPLSNQLSVPPPPPPSPSLHSLPSSSSAAAAAAAAAVGNAGSGYHFLPMTVVVPKLRELTTLVTDFLDEQMTSETLLEELDAIGGFYACSAQLLPILSFIGVNVDTHEIRQSCSDATGKNAHNHTANDSNEDAVESAQHALVAEQLRSGELRRIDLQTALTEELTYISHVMNIHRYCSSEGGDDGRSIQQQHPQLLNGVDNSDMLNNGYNNKSGTVDSGNRSSSSGSSSSSLRRTFLVPEVRAAVAERADQELHAQNIVHILGDPILTQPLAEMSASSSSRAEQQAKVPPKKGKRSFALLAQIHAMVTSSEINYEPAIQRFQTKRVAETHLRHFEYDNAVYLFDVKLRCFNTQKPATWQNKYLHGFSDDITNSRSGSNNGSTHANTSSDGGGVDPFGLDSNSNSSSSNSSMNEDVSSSRSDSMSFLNSGLYSPRLGYSGAYYLNDYGAAMLLAPSRTDKEGHAWESRLHDDQLEDERMRQQIRADNYDEEFSLLLADDDTYSSYHQTTTTTTTTTNTNTHIMNRPDSEDEGHEEQGWQQQRPKEVEQEEEEVDVVDTEKMENEQKEYWRQQQLQKEADPSFKVLIDNLPDSIDELELRRVLRQSGEIEKVWLYKDIRRMPSAYRRGRTPRRDGDGGGGDDSSNNSESATENPDDEKDEFEEDGIYHELDHIASISDSDNPFDSDYIMRQAAEQLAARQSAKAEKPVVVLDDKNTKTNTNVHANGIGEAIESSTLNPVPAPVRATKGKVHKNSMKTRVLEGSSKTDNYAFVLMKDQQSFDRITRDALKLFGISIDDKSCRIFPCTIFKSFDLEVGQEHSVENCIEILNDMFDGEFRCYMPRFNTEKMRPVFIRLQFDRHADCWSAFHKLQRVIDASNHHYYQHLNSSSSSSSSSSSRPSGTSAYAHHHKPLNMRLLWKKNQWYKEWFLKSSQAHERIVDKKEEKGREFYLPPVEADNLVQETNLLGKRGKARKKTETAST